MALALRLSDGISMHDVLAWLRDLIDKRAHGFLSLPDGEELVVLRVADLAALDSIVSDPAFLSALETGVSDVLAGRTTRVSGEVSLREAVAATPSCDASMAEAVERGVADALAGRTSRSRPGESLGALMQRITKTTGVRAPGANGHPASTSARAPKKQREAGANDARP